jgi:hypothetical protein
MVSRVIFISLLGALIISCKKSKDRSCIKFVGDNGTVDTLLTSFDTIRLYDDLKYILIQDSIFKVKVEGGENVIGHVKVENENNTLTLKNENKCNFLRSYKEKMTVYIHCLDVNYIYFEGSEQLRSQDTLVSSELRVLIRDGAGNVDLTVRNGYMSAVVTHGWGNFILRGITLDAYLNCSTNSYCDTRDLEVENTLNVNSNTQGDMFVNANVDHFDCLINQKGDIYYEGNPLTTTFEYNGEGEVIYLE